MSKAIALHRAACQRRLQRFWTTRLVRRGELHDFAQGLDKIGAAAVFGGMIRDIAFGGVLSFKSDVDLVVESDDEEALAFALRNHEFVRNRFGGYRVRLNHWFVDVWLAKNTWAFVNGYVNGGGLLDLPKTTFFNWDAAVYELRSQRLRHIGGYFAAIQSRTLDINLAANPNPHGLAHRTMKMIRQKNARLTPRLASFLWQHLRGASENTPDESTLRFRENLIKRLDCHLEHSPLLPFEYEPVSASLFAPEAACVPEVSA